MSFSAIQREIGMRETVGKYGAADVMDFNLPSSGKSCGFKVNADYSCLAGAVGAGNTIASLSLFTSDFKMRWIMAA